MDVIVNSIQPIQISESVREEKEKRWGGGRKDKKAHLGRLDGRSGVAHHELQRQRAPAHPDRVQPPRDLRPELEHERLCLLVTFKPDSILPPLSASTHPYPLSQQQHDSR